MAPRKGMADSFTQAIEGNFSHLMGMVRGLGRSLNELVDNVEVLQEQTDVLESTAGGGTSASTSRAFALFAGV